MNRTHVILAAAVICVSLCILQTAAVPFTQQEQQVDLVNSEVPQMSHQVTETSPEQSNPMALFRTKRQSHLSLCRYCCNCCRNKGCGFCCKF